MPANGQPVVIRELDFPYATLVLDGRDRPEQGLEVSTTQEATTTWMPGRKTATAHVMTTKEDPFTLTGRWNDDFQTILGDTPQRKLTLIRGISLRGQRCKVYWGDVLVRFGRVSQVTPTFYRDDDIGYSIQFTPDEAAESLDVLPLSDFATNALALRRLADDALDAWATAKAGARAVRLIATAVF